MLAFGDAAPQQLGDTGHGYLTLLTPLVTMALAFVAGRAIIRPGAEPTRSWRATWSLLAAALLAIYVCQELTEGWLAAGHADGLTGVFGMGGWLAMPLAVGFAGLASAALHVGGSIRREFAQLRSPRLLPKPASLSFSAQTARPRVAVMASAGGGRAPPVASL